MANVAHSTLTGANLHEPKGIAAATVNKVYISDGAGSGAWTALPSTAGRWVLLGTEAGASVTYNFPAFNPSSYIHYKLVIDNLLPTTDNVSLSLRTSTDGGATYDSGASDYIWVTNAYAISGNYSNSGNPSSVISLTGDRSVSNSAYSFSSGTVTFINPGASNYCRVLWDLGVMRSSGDLMVFNGCGHRSAVADVNSVRLFYSSGNIASGTVKLYGLLL